MARFRLEAALPDNTLVLFLGTALLWGSGALVTTSQVAVGSPEPSVALRMLILCPLALGAARLEGQALAIRRAQLKWVAAQGIAMFGLAFVAFYHATSLIPSGLAALVLSTSGLFAALFGWIVRGTKLAARTLAGIITGLGGLGIIIAPQIGMVTGVSHALTGIAWAALAAMSTGVGALISEHTGSLGIPPLAQTGWGALFGGLFALIATVSRPDLVLPAATPTYMGGLVYMVFVASFLCFALYLRLIRKVGAASASYVMTLVPLVAIVLSAFFEGYAIDLRTLAGAAAILAGNLLIWRD